MLKSYVEYCKDHIIDHIHDYVGQMVYGADFTYTITEEANVDGTCTYSAMEAMEYIKEWFEDAGAYYEYHKDNFGDAPVNPFEYPEAYMTCMVIQGCSILLSDAPVIRDNWNNRFELTEEAIDDILEHVRSMDRIVM